MNVRRKAFILTEILTGMMLQAGFILTLCGAFYMLVSFSTSTQQILAAHDEGQIVISYIDNRIRNAGLGLWKCGSPAGVSKDFGVGTNFPKIRGDLPVAITSTSKTEPDSAVVSSADGIYKGNVLTLLYAHRDTKDESYRGKLIVISMDKKSTDITKTVVEEGVEISASTSEDGGQYFRFLDGLDILAKTNFLFGWSNPHKNINLWAVMEATGVPLRLSNFHKSGSFNTSHIFKIHTFYENATIYSMSELLNLECENMYVSNSTGERSFMIRPIKNNGEWDKDYPHTGGILEIYMELDTNPSVPIFTIKVLVSEGINENGTTKRPDEWPADYWYENNSNGHEDFRKYKVHISRASWKLYNLAPLF